MFTDTHCHLNIDAFDDDFNEVISRLKKEGVSRVINVACDIGTAKKAIELSDKYDFMYSTAGLHPHEAKNFDQEILNELENFAKKNKKVIAIGETGLDFYRNLSTNEEQKQAFVMQINLAKKLDLPVIIHCRDAYEETYAILEIENHKKVVFHCYSGTLDFAKKLWNKGWYTSFSGVLTYPKNEYLREVAQNCPNNLFLLETDCPYLAPQKYRGQRNEPSFIIETAKCLAEIKNISLEVLSILQEENVKKLFKVL